MSQMKDIARGLAANGAATRPDNRGYYLLFTDSGRFVVKHWKDGAFGDEQLVTTSARPDSAAAYIPAIAANPKPLAICITSASRVAVFQFSEEEEEWTEDATLPALAVHPTGKLAAVLWKERVHIVFQGTSGELFYVSAADDYIHNLCETTSWADAVVASVRVEPLKQLFVASNEKQDFFEAYALTMDDAVLHVPSGGERTVTGRVDPDGSYVSTTKAEWAININLSCVIA